MYIAIMIGLIIIAVGSGFGIAQLYLAYHPRLSRLKKVENEEHQMIEKKIQLQENYAKKVKETEDEFERKKKEWKKELESLRNKNRSNRSHIGQLKKDINISISILNRENPNTGHALRVLRKAYQRENK